MTLDLLLMPNDEAYRDELRARCAGADARAVLDPVPYQRPGATLNGYDVGVFVLPPVNVNYEWTLPNKFFDYVQARLGVIVGPSPEMAGEVDAHRSARSRPTSRRAVSPRCSTRSTPRPSPTWKRASDACARELSGEVAGRGLGRRDRRLLGSPS